MQLHPENPDLSSDLLTQPKSALSASPPNPQQSHSLFVSGVWNRILNQQSKKTNKSQDDKEKELPTWAVTI